MARKNSYLTVTDQFCGAGGSSQGVRNVAMKKHGGLEVKLALNHWKLAIETHNTNFPDTLHDCTDISASDPRRYPSTDILITSPECTNHSLAKGKKMVNGQMSMFDQTAMDPTAERSRATMWDVPRFAEYHRYNIIIVENVVDARKWIQWPAWIQAMHLLEYDHECVYANSMFFFPTPQSRDRMYVVFWRKGNRKPHLEFTPIAHCHKCSHNVNAIQCWKNPQKRFGKYKQQYVYCCPYCTTIVSPYYYASFNCIDWSDPGKRIGDRLKPLAANTIKRIEHGLKKYGGERFILHAAYSDKARGVVKSVFDPAFTQTSFTSQAIATPMIINDQQSTGIDCRVRGSNEPLQTLSTVPHFKLVTPLIIKGEHTQQETGYVKSAAQPLHTQTVRQSMSLVVPYILEMNRTGKMKRITDPASTFTAGGINQAMVNSPILVENKGQSTSKSITDPAGTITTKPHLGIVTGEAWNSFVTAYYNGSDCSKHMTEELGTVTTNDRHGLVNYVEPKLQDCYYRMLKPNEIKLAMAFDKDYIVLGSGKDQVKQLGNAVTPPVMEWLINQCIESLT